MFITAGPGTKLCAGGKGGGEVLVLRDTTSVSLSVVARTSKVLAGRAGEEMMILEICVCTVL